MTALSIASRSRALELIAAATLFAACGPTGPGGGGGGGGGDGGGGSGDVDSNPGGGSGVDSSTGSGGGADAMACASMPHKAEAAPLDMYLMIDQSGSMQGTKWTSVTTALKTFVQQPNLSGFSVGLQYFGLTNTATCPLTCTLPTDCGTGNLCISNVCLCLTAGTDSCTAADYAHPDVEIAALPGASSALVASINAHAANSGTPTSAALQGAIDHARAWAQTHPADVVVDVLATDGDPAECDTDLTHINAIAAAGLNGNPKVLTFVIGVGTSLGALNGIAAAGGTNQAFIVDTNGNVGQQFLDALNTIRGSALGCRYSIPVPTTGMPDYDNVSVTYTPSGGGAVQTIPRVQDQAACPATGAGWYYDDNNNPAQIILCTNTCGTVSADLSGQVDIFTPCEVIVN